MTIRISTGLILATLAPLGTALPATTNTEAGCGAVARAVLQASHRQADASFWLQIGGCLNDPGCQFVRTWEAALVERRAARGLAQQQLEARLSVCALLGPEPYAPHIVPAEFSSTVDNPYFPLVPGRTLIYEKRTKDGFEHIEVTTLAHTVEIRGVPCREVRVVETVDGVLAEETNEWFAQHRDGTVWYFGESVRHYQDGFLRDLAGSWRMGVEGGQPGVLMPATPVTGHAFRREFAVGAAEDVARVLSTSARVTVPFGDFADGAEIEEWSPLEPLELLIEIFIPGIGLVAEIDPGTGERLELVDIVDAPR